MWNIVLFSIHIYTTRKTKVHGVGYRYSRSRKYGLGVLIPTLFRAKIDLKKRVSPASGALQGTAEQRNFFFFLVSLVRRGGILMAESAGIATDKGGGPGFLFQPVYLISGDQQKEKTRKTPGSGSGLEIKKTKKITGCQG